MEPQTKVGPASKRVLNFVVICYSMTIDIRNHQQERDMTIFETMCPSKKNTYQSDTEVAHDRLPPYEITSTHSVYPSATVERPCNYHIPSGWHLGTILSFSCTIIVFVLNLTLTVWVSTKSKYKVQNGLGTLFQGSCARTRQLNVWIHLLVNILGTLLLSGSNYCMQVLISPTRQEVDCAHEKRIWIHIGIPSLRNLRHIATERTAMWTMLLLSSMPLHLFYNSVVFTNLQANSYTVIPTMDDWLHGDSYNTTGFVQIDSVKTIEATLNTYRPNLIETITLNDGEVTSRYKNTSTGDCFRTFNRQYMSNVGNVYLVQSKATVWRNQNLWRIGQDNVTGEYEWFSGDKKPDQYVRVYQINMTFPFRSNPKLYPSNRWRCSPYQSSTCNFPMPMESTDGRFTWEPYQSRVQYCMIEQVTETCKLHFSFVIMGIVLFANLVKIICIARLIHCHGRHRALVTLGDALASFLERPDEHTFGRCLASEVQIDRALDGRTFVAPQGDIVRYHTRRTKELENQPRYFKLETLRWSAAPGCGVWFATYAL